MDAPVVPAEGNGTPNAESVAAETPTTTTAAEAPVSEPASTPATSQPSTPAPTKPDMATLLADAELRQAILKDPEFRRELFKHPETQAEMEHRIASEAGRRAKADLERWQQQEAARLEQDRQRQERERLLAMDEYELGQYQKQELAKQAEEEALQARLRPWQEEREKQLLRWTADQLVAAVHGLGQEAGATPEELAQLLPNNFTSLTEFFRAAAKFMGGKEGKKLAKELVKVEAAAMVEEKLNGEREKSPSPAVLPSAEPAQSDKDFIADYAAGKSNDHARYRQWAQRNNALPV